MLLKRKWRNSKGFKVMITTIVGYGYKDVMVSYNLITVLAELLDSSLESEFND